MIKNAVKVTAKLLSGETIPITRVYASSEFDDLAILEVDKATTPTATVGNSETAKIGSRVYVIGNPQGLENSISDGLLSGIREFPNGRRLLQISAPISPGSSGSPVINSGGEVIGVAVSQRIDGQNLNFAVPINRIASVRRQPNAPTIAEFGQQSAFSEGVAQVAADNYDAARRYFKQLANESASLPMRRLSAHLLLAIDASRCIACGSLCDDLSAGVRNAAENKTRLPNIDGNNAFNYTKTLELDSTMLKKTGSDCKKAFQELDADYENFGETLGADDAELSFSIPRSWSGDELAVDLLILGEMKLDIAEGRNLQSEDSFERVLKRRTKHAFIECLYTSLSPKYGVLYPYIKRDVDLGITKLDHRGLIARLNRSMSYRLIYLDRTSPLFDEQFFNSLEKTANRVSKRAIADYQAEKAKGQDK